MFDIFTRTCPQVRIQVRADDTDTGQIETSDLPIDLEGVNNVADVADRITAAAEEVGIDSTAQTPTTDPPLPSERLRRIPLPRSVPLPTPLAPLPTPPVTLTVGASRPPSRSSIRRSGASLAPNLPAHSPMKT